MESCSQALFQFRFGERYHYGFRQESQIAVDQRRQFQGWAGVGFFLFVERSTNLTCLRMDLFPTNVSVFVVTRKF